MESNERTIIFHVSKDTMRNGFSTTRHIFTTFDSLFERKKGQAKPRAYFLPDVTGVRMHLGTEIGAGEGVNFVQVSGDSIYLEGRYGQVYNMLQPGTAICNPL